MKKSTMSVHAGSRSESNQGGINSPIFTSSAIEYLGTPHIRYPRYFNTFNQQVVADKLCALESAEDGMVTSSGMAAISAATIGLLAPGDHAIVLEGVYGGTYGLVTREFDRLGIDYSFCAGTIPDLSAGLRPNTKLLFVESPTNPLLSVVDLTVVAEFAREFELISVIDNTFATPILQNPLRFGFDLVVHSGTKYLGGHSDLSCGAILGSAELIGTIRAHALMYGGNLNAQDCALLERSLKTLALRVRQQSVNAMAVAEALDQNEAVQRVYYPGLESHPGHDIAVRQMSEFGGMLSFELAEDIHPTGFLSQLKWIPCAVSLGGIETIVSQPVATSHEKVPKDERERLGIRDQLIRVSVGIEDAADIVSELRQALESSRNSQK